MQQRKHNRRRGIVASAVIGTMIGALFAGLATTASAQVRGTIFGPGVRQFPIAVSDLKNLTPTAGDSDHAVLFAQIVARDLEISGHFRVVPRDTHIEAAQSSGITAESINFPDWSVIGALALVKGSLRVEGDQLRVEARLFDVFQRRLLLGRNYQGSAANLRRMAHRFADEIMLQLTGERGPFDSRIAFVSNRGGRFKELYVTSLDGGDVRQVTFNQTLTLSPSWGPQGSLLFTSYQRGNPDLYRFDALAGTQSRLVHGRGLNLGGKYSPDGTRIALASEERGSPNIVLVDPAGRLLSRVTDSYALDVSPSWSPDGKQLAFCSDRAGNPQIYIVDAAGGTPRRVTSSGGYNTSPAWSPRGDRIAYVGRVSGRFHIFTVNADGSDARQITSGAGDNEDPSWSPDGRYLVFSSTRTGARKLFVSDVTGASQVQLTRGGGDDSSPAWSKWLD